MRSAQYLVAVNTYHYFFLSSLLKTTYVTAKMTCANVLYKALNLVPRLSSLSFHRSRYPGKKRGPGNEVAKPNPNPNPNSLEKEKIFFFVEELM